MKSIHGAIVPIIIAGMLGLFHATIVTAETYNPSGGVEEAKRLYSQATSLAVDSPKRVDLLDRAAEILTKEIEDNPKSLDAHRKLMGVYLLKQDYHKGIRVMQDAITLSPQDPKLFVTLAFLYEHSGALEYAKAMLDQALTLDPDQALVKDYRIAIQQKIDARDMQQAHNENVNGTAHAKPLADTHPPLDMHK